MLTLHLNRFQNFQRMNFKEQKIKGLYLLNNFVAKDTRGAFIKTFNSESFKHLGFAESFRESYYSKSHKNVIRGMHFQIPPFDHHKLVYVTHGQILDVVLDLRKSSNTFGEVLSFILNEEESSLLIPKGCAHGFLTLSDTATVVYNVTTVYNQSADSGIRWNSFGFNWDISDPIISARDLEFPLFKKENNYFS